MITYSSTRGGESDKSFTEVMLAGMASDGGLFVPDRWPSLPPGALAGLSGASYVEVARAVMAPFLDDQISAEAFDKIIAETYGAAFDHPAVAPLVEIGPNAWIMELFHGPTLAFKDYALQLLGRLFDHVLAERGQRITIVGATSGDTGSAAIEACRGCANIDIFILHPKGRTSEVQRRQMTTVDAPNVHNVALEGSFDDCQALVKALFADASFRDDVRLSAVNSINWARVMAQIVYYVNASLHISGAKKPVRFAVPTGNFGNVYAAHAARQMGLSIESLIIGSNRNDILTRFFETGTMKAGAVEPSLSPSMDIQVSSNFERYLHDLMKGDGARVSALMKDLKEKGSFTLDETDMRRARRDFTARRCSDNDTKTMMAACYKETGYLIDPHTAVGLFAAGQAEPSPDVPLVALACAHPAKFPDAVEAATGIRPALPPAMADLFDRPEHYTTLSNDAQKLQDFVKANRQA